MIDKLNKKLLKEIIIRESLFEFNKSLGSLPCDYQLLVKFAMIVMNKQEMKNWTTQEAPLIRAAPYLINALKNALMDYDNVKYDTGEMLCKWVDEARDAIAKANGE